MRLPRTHAWVCLVVLTSFGLGPALADQPADIQAALDAGAWDQARTLLPASPELADPWLGRIALAQFHAGDAASAGDTLRRIHSPGELSRAANSIAQQAQGGASGADFDSLINLITATVAPDSWDEVGGPGTVQSFSGGAFKSTRRDVWQNGRRRLKLDLWTSSEMQQDSPVNTTTPTRRHRSAWSRYHAWNESSKSVWHWGSSRTRS